MPHLFCFGLGYSSLTLAKELLAKGWRISGTCRNSDKIEQLRKLGITAYIFDNDLPLQEIWDLQSVTHILHSIPPHYIANNQTQSLTNLDPVYQLHLNDIKNLKNLQWLGYLSTTGVYGNHDGAWVDENTPCNPPPGRNKNRADAESAWLASGLPTHIFRLSGIYGPGRNILKDLSSDTAHRIDKPGHFFSRIHVDDIAQILQASIAKPNPGAIYNCADDEPAEQRALVEYAANLLGISPPPLTSISAANLSPMALSFWENNRRINNDRIKNELEVLLKYANYRQGLETLCGDYHTDA